MKSAQSSSTEAFVTAAYPIIAATVPTAITHAKELQVAGVTTEARMADAVEIIRAHAVLLAIVRACGALGAIVPCEARGTAARVVVRKALAMVGTISRARH
eukprot:CAMPEP_0183349466 /NCGR_PEP_ID=MMETSP0164_2-20130417/13639_1 /TAXON_ID=221442 /ORGANISM="Coccolithus pelagicus ssp braarudi, Strain PLY182g" /LENGTH=100 /DNA_ID=CAMNT_0025521185 /DNA_START=436 /DNA_END=737 /DNA_ORIENTATION=-